MKKMKNLMATIASIILSFPFIANAQQDSGTYIDNLNVQDSSYMEQDLLAGTETASSGGSIAVIIIVAALLLITFLAALVDILKGKFEGNTKLIWILVILFLPILGPILYFLIGRKQKI